MKSSAVPSTEDLEMVRDILQFYQQKSWSHLPNGVQSEPLDYLTSKGLKESRTWQAPRNDHLNKLYHACSRLGIEYIASHFQKPDTQLRLQFSSECIGKLHALGLPLPSIAIPYLEKGYIPDEFRPKPPLPPTAEDFRAVRELLWSFRKRSWHTVNNYAADIESEYTFSSSLHQGQAGGNKALKGMLQWWKEEIPNDSKFYDRLDEIHTSLERLGINPYIAMPRDGALQLKLSREDSIKIHALGLPLPALALLQLKEKAASKDLQKVQEVLDGTAATENSLHIFDVIGAKPELHDGRLKFTDEGAAALFSQKLKLSAPLLKQVQQWATEHLPDITKITPRDIRAAQALLDRMVESTKGKKAVRYDKDPGGIRENGEGFRYRGIEVPYDFLVMPVPSFDFVDASIQDTKSNEKNGDAAAHRLQTIFGRLGVTPLFFQGGITFTPRDAATLFAQGVELPEELSRYAREWSHQKLADAEMKKLTGFDIDAIINHVRSHLFKLMRDKCTIDISDRGTLKGNSDTDHKIIDAAFDAIFHKLVPHMEKAEGSPLADDVITNADGQFIMTGFDLMEKLRKKDVTANLKTIGKLLEAKGIKNPNDVLIDIFKIADDAIKNPDLFPVPQGKEAGKKR